MTSSSVAARCAFAAAALFVASMALLITQQPPTTFSGAPPPIVVVVSAGFTLFHLSLLPVVAALLAPEWARGSGYAWIVVDNVIVFMSYFGVGADLVTPMRMGVHLAAASWLAGAGASTRGGARWVGWAGAAAFAVVSAIAPFVGAAQANQMLGPAGVLLVTWLVMAGARLRTGIMAA
jgi:hypothetical protein